jgi:O-antigen biosynthesis protein
MLPILVPLRNNLHLTRRCLASIRKQDIEVQPWLLDNGSSDGTSAWASIQRDILYTYYDPQLSVAAIWNVGLSMVFDKLHCEAAICLNNDTELLPCTARLLVEDGGGFVTGVSVDQWPTIINIEQLDPSLRRPHPDMSCFLIRKWVWEKVGEFDERFEIAFVEDLDMDMRMYKAGIRAYCLDLPFLHHRSSTLKNAEPAEARRIQIQADKNREYFKKKWGMVPGSPEFYQAMGKG